jgi:DNA-directed RNA polymerase specialized sigma24 family protein
MKRPPTPRPTDDEDAHLIRAVLGGRKELFQRLIEKYQAKLYAFGLRLCPEAGDAEEMVQDAFFQTYRFLPQFRFESRFKTCLYRIAGHLKACQHCRICLAMRKGSLEPLRGIPPPDLPERLRKKLKKTASS